MSSTVHNTVHMCVCKGWTKTDLALALWPSQSTVIPSKLTRNQYTHTSLRRLHYRHVTDQMQTISNVPAVCFHTWQQCLALIRQDSLKEDVLKEITIYLRSMDHDESDVVLNYISCMSTRYNQSSESWKTEVCDTSTEYIKCTQVEN